MPSCLHCWPVPMPPSYASVSIGNRARPRGSAAPAGVSTRSVQGDLVLVHVQAVPRHIRVESGLVRPEASKSFQQRANILIELVRVGCEIGPVDSEEVLVGVMPLLVRPEFSMSFLYQMRSTPRPGFASRNRLSPSSPFIPSTEVRVSGI
jgi:hypothetical protein